MLVRPQLKVNASPPFLGALAPRSDQKILQSTSAGDINVTNNRATILKSIQLDTSPATKNLVNISEVRHDEVGACSRFVEGSGKAECDEGPPTDDRGRVSDWERSSIGKGGRPSRVCVLTHHSQACLIITAPVVRKSNPGSARTMALSKVLSQDKELLH